MAGQARGGNLAQLMAEGKMEIPQLGWSCVTDHGARSRISAGFGTPTKRGHTIMSATPMTTHKRGRMLPRRHFLWPSRSAAVRVGTRGGHFPRLKF